MTTAETSWEKRLFTVNPTFTVQFIYIYIYIYIYTVNRNTTVSSISINYSNSQNAQRIKETKRLYDSAHHTAKM